MTPDAGRLRCPHCGELREYLVRVWYDAMVDGPGCEESEEMCDECAGGCNG